MPRNREIYRFITNLGSLRNLYEADKLIFSFVTGDNEEYLLKSVFELQDHFENNPNISFGKQFYDEGYLEIINNKYKYTQTNNTFKASKVIEYLTELSQSANVVNSFFADDSAIEHEVLKRDILKGKASLLNNNIESLYIKHGGIEKLNNILEEYIYENKKKTI